MSGPRGREVAVGITPLETRRDEVVRLAVRAEKLGYEGFYIGEGWGHDVAVLLAEIATRTSRIRIGTGVLNVWGRSPASIAMLANSLSELSAGRFVLGLGSGSPQLAEGWHDVAFRAPVARLAATTRQVRRLLDGERMVPSLFALSGSSRPLRLATRSDHHVPIRIAALGPHAVRVAGELADAWYPFLVPAGGLAEGARLLAAGAAVAGRSQPKLAPGLPMAVARDRARAREVASWWTAFYLSSMGPLYARTLRRCGYGDAVNAVLAANPSARSTVVPQEAEALLDDLTIWGTADDARASLERWYNAGSDLPILVLPPGRAPAELDYMLDALSPDGS